MLSRECCWWGLGWGGVMACVKREGKGKEVSRKCCPRRVLPRTLPVLISFSKVYSQ